MSQQNKNIVIPETITVRELADLMEASPISVIKELMANGVMANINQTIDFDTAAIVAEEMGFTVRETEEEVSEEHEEAATPTKRDLYADEREEDLQPRPPIVTVLGHVDHGKTTLLDAIRKTRVTEEEHGGITQHTGAYQVERQGRKITFIDTPGHEAFTAMRARGAQVTDIAILVIAANDGVMPQTKEALDHARAAQVPVIVVLNKIDVENANPDRVMQQMAEVDLVPEDWGGDTIVVPTSAKQGVGIDTLLDMILLVVDMSNFRANPDRPAVGTILEATLDRTRGPMATVLVQNGCLHSGDNFVAGKVSGRVRAMFNDQGKRIEEAPPSTPVQVLGFNGIPEAGELFEVMPTERKARSRAEAEASRRADLTKRPQRMTLQDIYARFQAGQVQKLNIILKVDVQGSLEPIVNSLQQLGDENLRVKILRKGTGNISETDIMLAAASNAIVIGFNVEGDISAHTVAEKEGVDIRTYKVIYQLVDDVEKALTGMLEPVYQDVTIGRAEVQEVFHIRGRGNIAGCMVREGKITRGAFARVWRGEQELHSSTISSLRRFKDDVREVATGYECGIGLEGFEALQPGDIIEAFIQEQV
ncbi:MAG: translation initiation factor IF-2 [Chloroflexi bacterium]|nr:translation initiation factor IF-2 [Chloroflexota bacterium]